MKPIHVIGVILIPAFGTVWCFQIWSAGQWPKMLQREEMGTSTNKNVGVQMPAAFVREDFDDGPSAVNPAANAVARPAACGPTTHVYHYKFHKFHTKSGLIGRDFTKPLTPQEQSTIARQIAEQDRQLNTGKSSQTGTAKPDGAWAGSQALTLSGGRSGLLTYTAGTENVSSSVPTKSSPRLLNLSARC